MLLNTKSKVPGVTEVASLQFIFLDLETPFKNLLGLHKQVSSIPKPNRAEKALLSVHEQWRERQFFHSYGCRTFARYSEPARFSRVWVKCTQSKSTHQWLEGQQRWFIIPCCRLEFDHSIAPTLWQLLSGDRLTLQRRCWGRVFRFWFHAWGSLLFLSLTRRSAALFSIIHRERQRRMLPF